MSTMEPDEGRTGRRPRWETTAANAADAPAGTRRSCRGSDDGTDDGTDS